MPSKPTARRELAFTFIEMLVVVSVVFILISLLLPALGMARTHARTVQGLSHLNQIGHAVSLYTVDHRNTFPPGYEEEPGRNTDWTIVLSHYIHSGGDTYGGAETLPIFYCPNATYPNQGNFHYSSHPVLMPDINPAASPLFPLYRMARLRRPSETILIMDGAQRDSASTAPYTSFATAWRLDAPDYLTTTPTFDKTATDNDEAINPGPNNDDGGAANGTIRWRQFRDTAANMLFVDGHAATLRPEEVKRRNIRVD